MLMLMALYQISLERPGLSEGSGASWCPSSQKEISETRWRFQRRPPLSLDPILSGLDFKDFSLCFHNLADLNTWGEFFLKILDPNLGSSWCSRPGVGMPGGLLSGRRQREDRGRPRFKPLHIPTGDAKLRRQIPSIWSHIIRIIQLIFSTALLKDRLPTCSAQKYWVGSYSSGREEARDCPGEKEDSIFGRPAPSQTEIHITWPIKGYGEQEGVTGLGLPIPKGDYGCVI